MKKGSIGIVLIFFLLAPGAGCLTAGAADEINTMMCDEGVVRIGDFAESVEQKCGAPDSRQEGFWRYALGPDEVYIVEFDENDNVVRIRQEM